MRNTHEHWKQNNFDLGPRKCIKLHHGLLNFYDCPENDYFLEKQWLLKEAVTSSYYFSKLSFLPAILCPFWDCGKKRSLPGETVTFWRNDYWSQKRFSLPLYEYFISSFFKRFMNELALVLLKDKKKKSNTIVAYYVKNLSTALS